MSHVDLVAQRTRVMDGIAPGAIPFDQLMEEQRPTILKGVASDWPLVREGLASAQVALAYLKRFDTGLPVVGFKGPPEIAGRFFYNDDVTGFNFEGARVGL